MVKHQEPSLCYMMEIGCLIWHGKTENNKYTHIIFYQYGQKSVAEICYIVLQYDGYAKICGEHRPSAICLPDHR